jgi:hypothetical protein
LLLAATCQAQDGPNSDATTTAARMGEARRVPTLNLEKAYKAAGATDEQIKQLQELDKNMMEARQAGDREKIRELRAERDKILSAEQRQKFGQHMREEYMQRRAQQMTGDGATTGMQARMRADMMTTGMRSIMGTTGSLGMMNRADDDATTASLGQDPSKPESKMENASPEGSSQ